MRFLLSRDFGALPALIRSSTSAAALNGANWRISLMYEPTATASSSTASSWITGRARVPRTSRHGSNDTSRNSGCMSRELAGSISPIFDEFPAADPPGRIFYTAPTFHEPNNPPRYAHLYSYSRVRATRKSSPRLIVRISNLDRCLAHFVIGDFPRRSSPEEKKFHVDGPSAERDRCFAGVTGIIQSSTCVRAAAFVIEKISRRRCTDGRLHAELSRHRELSIDLYYSNIICVVRTAWAVSIALHARFRSKKPRSRVTKDSWWKLKPNITSTGALAPGNITSARLGLCAAKVC